MFKTVELSFFPLFDCLTGHVKPRPGYVEIGSKTTRLGSTGAGLALSGLGYQYVFQGQGSLPCRLS